MVAINWYHWRCFCSFHFISFSLYFPSIQVPRMPSSIRSNGILFFCQLRNNRFDKHEKIPLSNWAQEDNLRIINMLRDCDAGTEQLNRVLLLSLPLNTRNERNECNKFLLFISFHFISFGLSLLSYVLNKIRFRNLRIFNRKLIDALNSHSQHLFKVFLYELLFWKSINYEWMKIMWMGNGQCGTIFV